MIRLLVGVVLATALLCAQEGTSLRGVVTDPQNRPVPGAEVRLFRQDTRSAIRTTTDQEGRYAFERLAAGSFLLQIDRESFRSLTKSVDLKAREAAEADIALEIAGVNDSVIVTASGAPQKLEEISKS